MLVTVAKSDRILAARKRAKLFFRKEKKFVFFRSFSFSFSFSLF